MANCDSIKIKNTSGSALAIVIEPWAVEFLLPINSSCNVVSVGGVVPAVINLEVLTGRIICYVETEGAVYEYWQDGKLVG
ncbi:hypothetical protein [Massilia sp. Root351]|uniref:hypothetical protein n=1 Tax=Massilia sp. Root351 TaxID=1736522 RepID=UPI0012F67CC0|nr:hypothetical protein [Massilia sp. Root351]